MNVELGTKLFCAELVRTMIMKRIGLSQTYILAVYH